MAMRQRRASAVADVSFGLDFSRPPIALLDGALQDGMNFRVRLHRLTNDKVGWVRTSLPTLNGPVMHIATYRNRAGVQKTVFATFTDLYQATSLTAVSYLTPRYATGTVDVSAADPAVVTDASGTPNWITNGINSGDQIHFGNAAQTSTAAVWYTIDTVDAEDQLTLTTAVAGAPLAGQAYTIRRLFTGDDTNLWEDVMWIDTGSAADYMYLTNGKDAIMRWDGSASQVEESAADFLARHLAIYSNMLIFGDITVAGNDLPGDVRTSTVGDPENTTSGLASQFKVHDSFEPILHMKALGDNLAIYSGPDPGSIVLAQFVGDPIVFLLRKAVSETGPISARVVADLGDFHQFLAGDIGYRFDGAGLLPYGEQVWQKFLGLRDPSRQHLAFHAFVEEHGEVIWAVPLPDDAALSPVASPTTAFVAHYAETKTQNQPDPFSRRSFPFLSEGFLANTTTTTWDDLSGSWDSNASAWNDTSLLAAFPQPIVGNHLGETFFLYQGHTADGTLLPSYVHFGRRPLNDGVERGLVCRIYPFARELVDEGTNLDVVLHLADSAHGEAVESEPYPLDLSLPEGEFFISPFRRARYVETEYQMNDVDGVWELAGYDWKLGRSRGIR